MKILVVACLLAVLFTVYSEARPNEQTREKLRESGTKLLTAIRHAIEKIRAKTQEKVEAYMEKDGLGEKIAEVIEILMKRLQARIEKYTAEH
ncbi:unnamed protein product [Calicophoron daubneyi]|uniref:Uncharacterized protein n=1 Tax=Calicophoron daubneyi TaxID=300641 RepID=A0AAV2T6G5_CALDB